MARYTDESRERVRDAVDFAEIVGARTELKRAGVNSLQGLCPFHDERTPSFGIDPAQKVYYCFGCQAGGDVFKFVMETERLDFASALETLVLPGRVPGSVGRLRRRPHSQSGRRVHHDQRDAVGPVHVRRTRRQQVPGGGGAVGTQPRTGHGRAVHLVAGSDVAHRPSVRQRVAR